MTNQERIRNLETLGYTPREAEFLCLAALNSGYFVRRQYADYGDLNRGGSDSRLADKMVRAGHVKELVFRHQRSVYSFCSKPFFRCLGDVDNRNRRKHEVITIKNRLVGLDFVLSNQGHRFLATEREKVSFFCDELGIAVEHLPAKRFPGRAGQPPTDRYFVEKFPIAVNRGTAGGQSIVTFGFIDESAHTTSAFERFLDQYRSLFVRVPCFRLLYIGTVPALFESAHRLFERAFGTGCKNPPVDPLFHRLLAYFADRDAYDKGNRKRFDQRSLIKFREDRREFSSTHYDSLFERWKMGGDHAVLQILCPESISDSSASAEFETHLSAFRYDLFGTLIGRDLTCR